MPTSTMSVQSGSIDHDDESESRRLTIRRRSSATSSLSQSTLGVYDTASMQQSRTISQASTRLPRYCSQSTFGGGSSVHTGSRPASRASSGRVSATPSEGDWYSPVGSVTSVNFQRGGIVGSNGSLHSLYSNRSSSLPRSESHQRQNVETPSPLATGQKASKFGKVLTLCRRACRKGNCLCIG